MSDLRLRVEEPRVGRVLPERLAGPERRVELLEVVPARREAGGAVGVREARETRAPWAARTKGENVDGK